MIPRAIRIYDRHSKQMVYPKQGTDRGVFVGMDGYPIQFDGKNFFKLDQCIPMYATGLRTKDGTMIWEGDIVEADVPLDFGGVMSFIKGKGVMVWNERGGNWLLQMKQSPMSHEAFQVTNSVVVGNIYEHKQLLKDEN